MRSLQQSFIFSFALLFFSDFVFAEREIPPLIGPVIDEIGLLSAGENAELSELLQKIRPKVQMQIWIIRSLETESIENLSLRAVDKWKLGDEKLDNGLLFLIATEDRRMRLEVGQGLEGQVPDILAGRILDRIVRANFREGKFYEGIRSAVDQVYKLIQGEEAPAYLTEKRAKAPIGLNMFIIIIFVLMMVVLKILNAIFGGFGGRGYRRSGWGPGAFGGGFGGGGFGGGWSGGGGGFSGGGSSSSW